MMTIEEHQMIHYSVENVSDIPDDVLLNVIQAWRKSNPNLEFIQSENSEGGIRWAKYAPFTHTGLATCTLDGFGIPSNCVLICLEWF